MADDQENQCANPVCTCPPQPDGKYCSASCEGKGQTVELDCDCGHPECSGNFQRLAKALLPDERARSAPFCHALLICRANLRNCAASFGPVPASSCLKNRKVSCQF